MQSSVEGFRCRDSGSRFQFSIYRKFALCENDLPGSDQDMSRKGVSRKDGVAVILGLVRAREVALAEGEFPVDRDLKAQAAVAAAETFYR